MSTDTEREGERAGRPTKCMGEMETGDVRAKRSSTMWRGGRGDRSSSTGAPLECSARSNVPPAPALRPLECSVRSDARPAPMLGPLRCSTRSDALPAPLPPVFDPLQCSTRSDARPAPMLCPLQCLQRSTRSNVRPAPMPDPLRCHACSSASNARPAPMSGPLRCSTRSIARPAPMLDPPPRGFVRADTCSAPVLPCRLPPALRVQQTCIRSGSQTEAGLSPLRGSTRRGYAESRPTRRDQRFPVGPAPAPGPSLGDATTSCSRPGPHSRPRGTPSPAIVEYMTARWDSVGPAVSWIEAEGWSS